MLSVVCSVDGAGQSEVGLSGNRLYRYIVLRVLCVSVLTPKQTDPSPSLASVDSEKWRKLVRG